MATGKTPINEGSPMTHLRAFSFALILVAVTGYAVEPYIYWHRIVLNPPATYITFLGLLAVLGLAGVMWRKR